MKILGVLVLLLSCVSGLVELNDDTFVEFIKKPGSFCVMFYSPTCGACVEALPVFKKVAELLQTELPALRIGQIDVVDHTASGDRYDVWNYPTIIIDGATFQYQMVFDNAMNEKELANWMKKYGAKNYVPPKSNLLLLNQHDFEEKCTYFSVCVVQFTDSRCQQCNARRNQIHEAANNIDKEGHKKGIRIAQVDLYKYPDVGKTYGIKLQGFVEHRTFSFGDMFNYYATDDWGGIVDYANKRLKDSMRVITKMKDYKNDVQMVEKDTAVVLVIPKFGQSKADGELFRRYYSWAGTHRDYAQHFVVYNADLCKELNIKDNTLIIKRYFETISALDDPQVEIPVPANADAPWFLKQFKENEYSLVNHMDGWRRIKSIDNLKHYVGIYHEDPAWGFEKMSALKERIAKISVKFVNKIHFFVGDIAEVSVDFEERDTINAEVPYHFMIHDNKDRKYSPDLPTLNAMLEKQTNYDEYVTEYVTQYLAGEIKPHIKSDEDPGDLEGVIDVMGLSVDRVFNNTHKDILLLLSSSDKCRSCNRYESVFLEFGELYENNNTLTVGLVNTETNAMPRPLVMKSSPPNIVLVPGNRKSLYENIHYFFDEISVENLLKFVQQYGTHKPTAKPEDAVDEETEEEEPDEMKDDDFSSLRMDMVEGGSMDEITDKKVEESTPINLAGKDIKLDSSDYLDKKEIKEIFDQVLKDEKVKDEL